MSNIEANESQDLVITEDPSSEIGEHEVPEYSGPGYSPDDLMYKMSCLEYEFEYATAQMQQIEVKKTIREMKTKVILSSRSFHLLTNEKLRSHLIECFDRDPKFRITAELFEAFIFIEHQEIFEQYNFYEKAAKQAKERHEMLGRQLSWYQTKAKREIAEMDKLGGRNFTNP